MNGEVRDLYVRDGRIVAPPAPEQRIDREYDLAGRVVMAGAIDMHTHIGGGKLNIARAMLPEDHRADPVARTALTRASCGHAAPGTLATGYRYAEMGYTACFEPAMLPVNARQAHLEMGDTPIVDKGGYVMLGSDDFLLRLMAAGEDQKLINDYVAWTLQRDPLHRHQGGESGRHLRVQVQPAEARAGREAPVLRRHARATSCGCSAGRCTSWACRIRCTCTAATSACRATWTRRSAPSAPPRACRST